ncbi:MAG: sigma-70 family RNA polymerase sigma factor [Chloroflexi bacterium]|nr:sigma-70 family RNA polymerase sigma factor [Chloroflexota bacterium]
MIEYSALQDEDIIRRLCAGESWAMAVLYDRYDRLVFSLALKILRDRSAAEEVVQEVFVKVWRRARDYQAERAKFSSWLARIAHNHAIDKLRQRNTLPYMTSDEHAAQIVDVGPTPHDMAEQQLDHRRIVAALDQIPGEQRRAIELAYFDGFTHQQIARKLGTPLGTVKTRIRRGMQNLKLVLQQPEFA